MSVRGEVSNHNGCIEQLEQALRYLMKLLAIRLGCQKATASRWLSGRTNFGLMNYLGSSLALRAYALRKITRRVRRLRARIDMGALLELGEGQAGVEPPCFIEILRHIAAGEDLPAERNMFRVDQGVEPDIGRAVAGQGIVELGTRFECVDLPHVLQKKLPVVL